MRALLLSVVFLLAGPPTTVVLSTADPSIDASLPQVAVDAHGDAFAVWQERRPNGTFTRAETRPVGGRWSAVRTLARGGFVSLAVDGRGDAVVAGLTLANTQGVFAVYRPAGGEWGRAVLVSGPGGAADAELSAAIEPGGRASVAWARAGTVEISVRQAGRWSTQTVGHGADPAIAVDAAGDGLLVWHTPVNGDGRFLASWKSPDGTWRQAQPIPSPTGPLIRPEQAQVALDGKGNASVVWTNWNVAVFCSTARRYGSFGRPQGLEIGNDALLARAAVAPGGAAVVAAVADRGDGPVELRIRSSAAAGWRPPIVLSGTGLQAALALDAHGHLVVAAIESQKGELFLEVATGTSAGHLSRTETLATVGGDCFRHRCLHGGDPAVAIGPGGHALVAWTARADPLDGGGVVEAADVDLTRRGAR